MTADAGARQGQGGAPAGRDGADPSDVPDDRSMQKSGRSRRVLLEEHVTRRILRAFFDVYNALGHGFLEAVYQEALARDMRRLGLEVEREVWSKVHFRGETIGLYRIDLLVERCVIVEVKCAAACHPVHLQQLTNYLRTASLQVGLLLNFSPTPTFRRAICSPAS